MNQPLWWQSGIIYQIYPRSFQDASGDGIGDLAGILARLDHLAWLGVNAIWLSPIYPSPMVDAGYDVSNFTDIDPLFGDLATFDELLAQAHRRDLKVIIDYVPNHTSDLHPWFLQSRSSRANPRRDWYVWEDAKPDGSPPNNWLATWGGSAWEWDAHTGQYYLHSYHVKMPDLNWRNPAVKKAMFDVLRFWLDRGVDGFRIDSAQRMMKDPDLRDNPPAPPPAPGTRFYKPHGAYDTQLHIHDKNHDDIHPLYQELRRLLDEYSATRPRVTLGELHIFDWPLWARFYGQRLDELHMPVNFGLVHIDWQPAVVREVIEGVEAALPTGAWPNYVLSNHDEPRLVSRVGFAQARVALMLLLTLRGTPTLYYGDEICMHDVEIPPERAQDPWTLNLRDQGFGRDPARTPMQWDASPNAGFCPPTVEPWLPLADDYQQINVAIQRDEADSFLTLTRNLIQLRANSPALASGSYTSVLETPDACLVYLRQSGSQRFLIALNFSGSPQTLHLPSLGTGALKISTLLDRAEQVDLKAFDLRPNEGCVIELAL